MRVRQAKKLIGEVTVPGDKSVSHRAVICAAMANGESTIRNFASGADCASTIRCLRDLGVEIQAEGDTVRVRGVGKTGFRPPGAPLDCGNSGTTMRLLTGVLAGQDFEATLTGDGSLLERPMGRIIEPLTKMGASIVSRNGRAPLRVKGRSPLQAIRYEMPVASAQVKSGILLAGLNAEGGTTVIEQVPTRDHTELMLKWFGADIDTFKDFDLTPADTADLSSEVELNGPEGLSMADYSGSTGPGDNERTLRVGVRGDSLLCGREIDIPGDISSAVFFLVGAACMRGSLIHLPNIGINPTRSRVINVLVDLGVDLDMKNLLHRDREPVADLRVSGRGFRGSRIRGNFVGGHHIPTIIDEIPALAVLGTQLEDGIEIRDAGELRIKESDRIGAICENLRRMGAKVTEFEDGFRVRRSELRGSVVDSFRDHRIAMAFAVAGLLAEGETEIVGHECVEVSFPGFFDTLEWLARRDLDE
jgi:3-phosphoshikimate 1-carboxyvinyltransferase